MAKTLVLNADRAVVNCRVKAVNGGVSLIDWLKLGIGRLQQGWRRIARATALMLSLSAAFSMAAGQAFALSFIRDAELERTLKMLTAPVFKAAGIGKDEVKIYIVNDPTLNAFVAGGANIFLFTGLMEQVKTPEGLISVVAHETGHITGNHLARRKMVTENLAGPALIASILAAAAGAAAGSAGAAVGAYSLGQSTAQRALLAYSRGEEASADQAGITFMEKAGVDPAGMLEVLNLIRGQEIFSTSRQDPYMRTHPLSSDRYSFVRERVSSSPVYGRKVSDEMRYWHDRMRAKLEAFLDNPERVLSRTRDAGDEFSVLKRAVAFHRLPDRKRSMEEIDKLLALKPNDPFYTELAGQFLLEVGRADEAAQKYGAALKIAPNETLIAAGYGKALLATGDPDKAHEALKVLERAAAADPADSEVRLSLAQAYAVADRPAMASLVTAERYALRGSMGEAKRFARRALPGLTEGGPAWLRAQDVLRVAENATKDN